MYSEKLLKYYQQEMEFLMESGKSFTKKYPEIARHLDFSSENYNDPDIQRLIESTAFLNAKLQKRLDEENATVASEILNIIYPQFNKCIPAATIIQFSGKDKFIKKHTLMETKKIIPNKNEMEENSFIFQTIFDVAVTNTLINNIEIITNDQNIKTEKFLSINLSNIENTKELTFFINMNILNAYEIYEALLTYDVYKNTPIFQNNEAGKFEEIGWVEAVGIDDDLLPQHDNEDESYKFLMEYNIFPKKFLFFKLKFQQTPKNNIFIPMNITKEIQVSKNNFLLNCSPAVNVFEKHSEPIMINHKTSEYSVIPDSNLSKELEIYSVLSIHDTDVINQKRYVNYFANCEYSDDEIYWTTKKSIKHDISSYSTSISFIDSFKMEKSVLYAKLLCVQRNANLIEANSSWEILNSNEPIQAINIFRPTGYIENEEEKSLWKLISHLKISYFGFDDANISKALKELIKIYDFSSENKLTEFDDIISIKQETFMKYENNVIMPCVKLIIQANNNPKIFLLANLLGKFLSMQTNFNTKFAVELTKLNGEKIKIWKIYDEQ